MDRREIAGDNAVKIARYRLGSAMHYGVVEENSIRRLLGSPTHLLTYDGTVDALSEVTLLPPIVPPNIIGIGLNYRKHADEKGWEYPTEPVIFLMATSSLNGPGEFIVLPQEAPDEVDYEAELAVVIGREARSVSPAEALDHVLGYACGNDVSARDCQFRRDKQWARGKSFDTFTCLGPWIETDLDPSRLSIRLDLNGETMQDSTTEDMIFPVADLISFISRSMTLLPGTVIMTGTPHGVGFARNPQRFLKSGDLIEVIIEGIGTLRNTVGTFS